MNAKKYNFEQYRKEFERVLLENFVPFWTNFSVDKEYGGYLCGFMRDGELFHEDKSVWQQGRSLWMFSKLYNDFGKNKNGLKQRKLVMISSINIVLLKTGICILE